MSELGKPERNEELRLLPEGQLEDVHDKTTKIQATLPTDLKDNLVRLLRRNSDLFASDMLEEEKDE
ncbi:hypothetical protein PIB30_015131 [Stylosanthes scabra]|uniref:Uncharacterized protein n=1 Tax=Stylosanthes scabra TaxID=79078 RepID=A0ABU6S6A8_9FABA|nr:hypothetical protein [Stylosanthes scabra]